MQVTSGIGCYVSPIRGLSAVVCSLLDEKGQRGEPCAKQLLSAFPRCAVGSTPQRAFYRLNTMLYSLNTTHCILTYTQGRAYGKGRCARMVSLPTGFLIVVRSFPGCSSLRAARSSARRTSYRWLDATIYRDCWVLWSCDGHKTL